ncbi:MAG: hypothetical protein K2Q03_04135 [Sphingobacteriaceae bacterium]|nr:hypothetical protein [Sphingobacteriaceae bacterium]
MEPQKTTEISQTLNENLAHHSEMLTPLEQQALMDDFYQAAKKLGLPNAEDFLTLED